MKRSKFLTIWLSILFLLSVAMTIDSLTYLSFIFHTKSFVSLFGIIAGFAQVWAVVQLFRWERSGVTLLISSAIVIFLVTGMNEFNLVSNISQIIESMLVVLLVNGIMFGILYVAIKPVWKNYK